MGDKNSAALSLQLGVRMGFSSKEKEFPVIRFL